MHVELHVGMGSEQDVLDKFALDGKEAAQEGSRVCFPQGQWVTVEGKRGQGGGVEEGGWHGLEQ